MNRIKQYIETVFSLTNPNLLRNILWMAIIIRLFSVIFAKGFGMHDDHFLVIEASQSWVDGTDYNNWLPSHGATVPSGHSFFYPGLHFIFFTIMKFFGMEDPQSKMYIIRFLYALFSLLTIVYGFKIANKLSGIKAARLTALLMAFYWFMPWLSVRNLVEVACIPFIMWGSWIYLKATTEKLNLFQFFLSGLIIGLAVNVRFQVLFFVFGFGLGMLILKQWKAVFLWSAGVVVSFCMIQFFVDLGIWGYPFAEFTEYIRYNLDNAYNYVTSPWYTYLLLIIGILLPVLSFFLFFGFLRSYKFQWALFAGTVIFIVFHSYFPNKQERFILPILPMLITLGVVGWLEYYDKSTFWARNKKMMKVILIIFWSLNLIILPVISVMYSKRSRVESMYYISKYANIKSILMEGTSTKGPDMPPLYYSGQWPAVFYITKEQPVDSLSEGPNPWGEGWNPRFILFFDDKNIVQRVDALKHFLPDIEFETTIKPGFIDNILFRLNPRNSNQTIVIYRNKEYFPKKL